jgi:hypothetical protein
MRLANKSLKPIAILIGGDKKDTLPYLSGPKLVDLFNSVGFDDIYADGFPSRWKYTLDKLTEINGTARLRQVLEGYADPRTHSCDATILLNGINAINEILKYDSFALTERAITGLYQITSAGGAAVEAVTTLALGQDFVTEQIKKCQNKIVSQDYNGAVTNARTLVEAVLIHVIESIEKVQVQNDGEVIKLWSRAKKCLKIDVKKDEIPEYVFQVISGLDTSLTGLAGISNNAGDRHANNFKTKKHHAKLAVNVAMTICDFLIDVLNEKKYSQNVNSALEELLMRQKMHPPNG